jgi:hypothetical protein
MKKIFLTSILLISFLSSHGGRTNSQGCHNQRGGSYHCHGKKAKKKKKVSTIKSKTSTDKFDCQRKYCKYMVSCEEAYYKLNTCGHASLDRDRDSIPCENICGG